MPFADRLPAYLARVEQALDAWLPPVGCEPRRLHQAMRYAVLGGGKRLRPTLIYATGETLDIEPARLDGIAAAVEMIHAYSLVHDDLPAMDNDDLRRGRPTCHKAFGEAEAILAGDALQALAFRVLAHDSSLQVSDTQRVAMIRQLSEACGSLGMAGGQSIDLAAIGRRLSVAEVERMHRLKTGALIQASVMLAVQAANRLEAAWRDGLDHYGQAIGLAFQIQDDILDEEADTETLGKTQGKDRQQHKPSYPAVAGMAAAKARCRQLADEAIEALGPLGARADALRWLAGYIVQRGS
ncbi:MAG TPA: farnesyl diphosphate synthase [Nevskiales bacterium]|nr:farnesyl diphosphate synthase [Nevskiales bacterium]